MITELVKHECHDTVRSKVEPMETGMLDLILDDVVLGTEDLSWEGLPMADSLLNSLTWVMIRKTEYI